jgi:transketolase C-terminal domain/subunit
MAISSKKPHYIRIEKEKLSHFESNHDVEKLKVEGYSSLNECESKVLVIATGLLSHLALDIARSFSSENSIEIAVFDVFQIKPLTQELLSQLGRFERVIVLEESYKSFLASELALQILDRNLGINLSVVACGEQFMFKGSSRDEMSREAGLSKKMITESINEILRK